MYSLANLDVRKAINDSGLHAYQVEERLGIARTTLSRLLRKELSAERKAEIFAALGGGQHEQGNED